MGNKEDNTASQSQDEVNAGNSKNERPDEKVNSDSPNKENEQNRLPGQISKSEQEAFIHNVEEPESLIDPGNEHHHIASE